MPAGGRHRNRRRSLHSRSAWAPNTPERSRSTTRRNPQRFDLVFTEGPEAGNRNRGIYELNGDTWKICLNMSGQSRARASFAAEARQRQRRSKCSRAARPPRTAEPSRRHRAKANWLANGRWSAAFQDGHALDASMVKTGRRVTSATHTTTYFGKQVFMQADVHDRPVADAQDHRPRPRIRQNAARHLRSRRRHHEDLLHSPATPAHGHRPTGLSQSNSHARSRGPLGACAKRRRARALT